MKLCMWKYLNLLWITEKIWFFIFFNKVQASCFATIVIAHHTSKIFTNHNLACQLMLFLLIWVTHLLSLRRFFFLVADSGYIELLLSIASCVFSASFVLLKLLFFQPLQKIPIFLELKCRYKFVYKQMFEIINYWCSIIF